jgi:hypothetical protein
LSAGNNPRHNPQPEIETMTKKAQHRETRLVTAATIRSSKGRGLIFPSSALTLVPDAERFWGTIFVGAAAVAQEDARELASRIDDTEGFAASTLGQADKDGNRLVVVFGLSETPYGSFAELRCWAKEVFDLNIRQVEFYGATTGHADFV